MKAQHDGSDRKKCLEHRDTIVEELCGETRCEWELYWTTASSSADSAAAILDFNAPGDVVEILTDLKNRDGLGILKLFFSNSPEDVEFILDHYCQYMHED
ncbi:unnamed protein product [Caenorhabditis nigoni]